MYNSILRYILQSFFFVALSAMLNLRYAVIVEANVGNIFASGLTLGLLTAFTIFSYKFIKRNKSNLSDSSFKASYGSLYANVEYYNHNEALKYSFYFCLRRLINASVIAFCQVSIVLQVFLLV